MHTRTLRTRARALSLTITLAALVGACGDSAPATTTTRGSGSPTGRRNNAAAAAGDAGPDQDASGPPAHGRVVQDIDFTESDRSRDPFRSFAREIAPQAESQGPGIDIASIKLSDRSLDELQVIAIIVGVSSPYAMLTDTTGAGTIIRRGDLVGRPDTIVTPGENGGPHQVPWRVARIVGSRISRDRNNNLTEIPAEVVFEREDRAALTPTRIERSLSLAPPGEGRGGPSPAAAPSGPALPALPSLPGGSPFLPPNPSTLPPGSRTSMQQSQQGSTLVQSYTTILPPSQPQPQQNSQPAPTTVVVQAPPQQNTQPQPAPLPDTPPPVRINGSTPFPSSGLPR
jgi:type IV pilus assembly protein PilP